MSAWQAAALWSALMILVLVALSIRVMRGRWTHRVSLGDGAEGQMTVLSRGFGNASEYIPASIGALVLLAAVGAPTLQVHIIGGLLLLGRIVHPFGLATPAPNVARAAGMMLTWLPLIGAAILLLMAAFAL